jgi:hypothetical protein
VKSALAREVAPPITSPGYFTGYFTGLLSLFLLCPGALVNIKNVANRSEESFNQAPGRSAILTNMKWPLKMQTILCHIRSGKWFEKAMFLAGVVGVGLAVFLSVRSSPAMMTVDWLPKFVANWLDHYGRFRNFPAFAMLAIPFLIITPKFLQRACIIALLAILIDSLELIQVWIPTRFADLGDIFWGWTGLLAAWGIFEVRHKIRQWYSLVVAAVCDRRKRRSQSAATTKKFETMPPPKILAGNIRAKRCRKLNESAPLSP